MAKKPISQRKQKIAAKISELQAQMQRLENEEVERIGKAAKAAGLVDLDLSDRELRREFKEIASRFQRQEERIQTPQATLP